MYTPLFPSTNDLCKLKCLISWIPASHINKGWHYNTANFYLMTYLKLLLEVDIWVSSFLHTPALCFECLHCFKKLIMSVFIVRIAGKPDNNSERDYKDVYLFFENITNFHFLQSNGILWVSSNMVYMKNPAAWVLYRNLLPRPGLMFSC